MEHRLSGVGVLDKSMVILGVLAEAGSARTLAEIAPVAQLPKPTVHRLLSALEVHGMARRDTAGAWSLGGRLISLGRLAAEGWTLLSVARPVLGDLRDETGESVQMYVAEGGSRRCIASLESPQELRTIVAEGAMLPLDRGSAGRALTGFDGPHPWVASVGERQDGVASVSAPIRVDGSVVAAVGVSGPTGRLGSDPGSRFGPEVVRAAERIAETASAITAVGRSG